MQPNILFQLCIIDVALNNKVYLRLMNIVLTNIIHISEKDSNKKNIAFISSLQRKMDHFAYEM